MSKKKLRRRVKFLHRALIKIELRMLQLEAARVIDSTAIAYYEFGPGAKMRGASN